MCTLTDIGRSQTTADYWQTAQSVFAISGTVNTVTAEDAHALACADGRYCADCSAGGRECIGRYAVHTNCESG